MNLNQKTLCAILLYGFLINQVFSQDGSLFSVSFGEVKKGKSRNELNLKDFTVHSLLKQIDFQAGLVDESEEWIRDKDNLLIPRARLYLKIFNTSPDVYIKYGNKTIIPESRLDYRIVQIFVNLFHSGNIEIFLSNKLVGVITVRPTPGRRIPEMELDYSCTRYGVEVGGFENQYYSLGCRMERSGKYGKERPRLEINWSATNLRLVNGAPPPYTLILHNSNPVIFKAVDLEGKVQMLSIKANLPKRVHRLKTAFGFGPYALGSEKAGEKISDRPAPALFFYGKFDFTTYSSLRFFDALVYNKTFFNNSGMYVAYQFADILDGRVEIVPLLGFQGLSYRFDKNRDFRHEIIFPQGAEFVYKNAFGRENLSIVYGLFFQNSSSDKYVNTWIRWGKKAFWELNYINWESGDDKVRTYGLSVGIPFFSAL